MERDRVTQTGQAGTQPLHGDSLQARTLQALTSFYALGASHRRKLMLVVGGADQTVAACLAALGLGGTCLILDADRNRLHSASRAGAVDFVVSGLTEALRILKNEVRKGTPVSVGLAAEPKLALREMLQRGVQPDLVCADLADEKFLQPFVEKGSALATMPAPLPHFASAWRLRCDTSRNLLDRRERDAHMRAETTEHVQQYMELSRIHQLWLSAAPTLFPKDRDRFYWGAE